MIQRYTTVAMDDIWSDIAKYKRWLRIEKEVMLKSITTGFIPLDLDTATKELDKLKVNVERIRELEAEYRHDVIAFVTHLEEQIDPEVGRYLHFGLTSSDVVDTAFNLTLLDATSRISYAIDRLIANFFDLRNKHHGLLMIGRTHGKYAAPITFGKFIYSFINELNRAGKQLSFVIQDLFTGKLSGAVGTNEFLSEGLEKQILDSLYLNREEATQVLSRDRYAYLFSTLAVLAGVIERFALQVRLLSRSEVGELSEGFAEGQRGSSAMPHKKNPILSENLTGLARVVRALASSSLENIALWHERDISHSSVERIIAPDITSLIHFMLLRCSEIVENLEVHEDKMREHLEEAKPGIFAQGLLLELIAAGASRSEAYKWVQKATQVDTVESFYDHCLFGPINKYIEQSDLKTRYS